MAEKFNPSKSLDKHIAKEARAFRDELKHADREARRREREAKHLSRYAIRQANRGKIDVDFDARTLPRFIPLVTPIVDDQLQARTNELLNEQGLHLEVHTDPADPNWDQVRVRVLDSPAQEPTQH